MSSNYYTGTSSNSTSTGYGTWNTSSITYQTRPIARILDTKEPGEKWTDVTRIGINGAEYKFGDIVSVDAGDKWESGPGIILGFENSQCRVRFIGSGDEVVVYYDYIKHLGADQAKTVKLDPNTAFKYKKRGRRY